MRFLARGNVLPFLLALFSVVSYGASNNKYIDQYHFYVGPLLGYGSTDWSMLRAQCDEACGAVKLSAPISAGDSGVTYGVVAGYEVQNHFAFEANFIQFPQTDISFGPFTFYPQFHHQATTITSNTYAFSFMGKFMVGIINTGVRAFANAGMAVTHREDVLADFYHVNPTFGVGIDYVFRPRWMVDTQFQYIAGYGTANLTPADNYSPFLYSVYVVLAHRF